MKDNGKGTGSGPVDPEQPHTEHEQMGWSINIPGHARRSDSPEYLRSRATMNKCAASLPNLIYGKPPYQDHHGGGLWLKDDQGWFLIRNLAGIEWSAQFAADPAKVDELRMNARRIYAAFPEAVDELGIRELLDTPITDAAGVARWTDSICNASVPLPAVAHTGVLPAGGGVHHYPSPITEIQFFKRADFQLWVTDEEGNPAAVVPVAHHGAGDGRVHVLWATRGSTLHRRLKDAEQQSRPLVVEPGHALAQQAYARQHKKREKS